MRLLWLLLVFLGGTAANGQEKSIDPSAFDFGTDPMRYIENDRLKLGINLKAGGAVTYLEDKALKSGNIINSADWGRQIQLSYYSGPIPFIGPNGEKPVPSWAGLGWNPIQAGSVARIPSKTIAFESGEDFLRVRCIPMQWPLENVPGDCIFEVTYRLVGGNAVVMEARLINNRLDRTQYPARHQEMPALYTNGPWYRLVTYLGDRPFSGAPLATIVGKSDGKGWPWSQFYAPEHWAALVNEDGHGVGLYQPDTAQMCGGFAGGDGNKGCGGPLDNPTGYLSPIALRILDANIDLTYRTHIVVGSLEEIREYAKNQPRATMDWDFASDRLGWSYKNVTDSGWPVSDGLKITFHKSPRGAMHSDIIFWKAEESPALEIQAAFEKTDASPPLTAEVVIQPFGPHDTTDFPSWPEEKSKSATEQKHKDFPEAPPIVVPFQVSANGSLCNYRIKLAGLPGYSGAMKQLRVQFPAADGTVTVHRIALTGIQPK